MHGHDVFIAICSIPAVVQCYVIAPRVRVHVQRIHLTRVQTTEESSNFAVIDKLATSSIYHNVHKKQPNRRPSQLGS